MTPEVSIIIVNWNGIKILPRCLEALQAQTNQNFEIIVVDNGSTDQSSEGLENRYPNLSVMQLGRNLGFAAANNRGASAARGKWLALLNNDAFPTPNWLEKLLDCARENPSFSFFACQLVSDADEKILDGAGDIYHISGMAWHRGRGKLASDFHSISGNQPIEVFSPCAAAALYDRQSFLDIGGFQERFFSHHEDVDLGFRLRLIGKRCLYVPQAIVRHIGSASFGVESDLTVRNGHRNLVWSYLENMPGILFWKYLPAHIIANVVFLIFYSLRGQGKVIWRAKWEAVKGIPEALRRRRHIQKNLGIEPEQISHIIDHGWFSPYILGRRTAAWRQRKEHAA